MQEAIDVEEINVEELLNNWGLSEYIPEFQKNKIDADAFLILTEGVIGELIKEIGPRVKFIRNLKLLTTVATSQKSSSISNLSTCSTLTWNSEDNFIILDPAADDNLQECTAFKRPISVETVEDTDQKPKKIKLDSIFPGGLEEYLFTSLEGRSILSLRNEELSDKNRNKLSQIISGFLFAKHTDKKIPPESLIKAAQEIPTVFPLETSATWYMSYQPKTAVSPHILPSGKLANRVVNYKQSLHEHNKLYRGVEATSVEDEDDVKAALEFIKNNLEPWNEIEQAWKITHKQRKKELNKGCTSYTQYFNLFPVLRQPEGWKLLLLDFTEEYPDKQKLIYDRWPQFSLSVLKLADKRNILKEKSSNDVRTILAFPSLFDVTTARSLKKNKNRRPSKEEVRDSFVLHVKNAAEINEKIAERKAIALEHCYTIQPFIILVGDEDSNILSYVRVDDILYRLDSPLKALDATFKIFYALDASYPLESAQVWSYIQKYIYDIPITERNYSGVETMRNSLINII